MATRSTHPRVAVAGARAGLLAGLLPRMSGSRAPRARRRPLGLVLAIALLGAPSPGSAETKETLKVQIPTAPVRLLAADCITNCWLSGLFAPAVIRERVAALAITNASDVPVSLTAKLMPSNGLALEYLAGHLTLQGPDRNDVLAAATPLPAGETVNLKIAAALGDGLPAGLYSAQLQLRATANVGAADPVAQAVAVELRVRDSAFWAVLAVLVGILVGRLAQLVYDPKLIARVQLLDWLYALRDRIDRLTDEALATQLRNDLMGLMRRLTGRGVDAATLQPEVTQLDFRITEAERPLQPAADLEVAGRQGALPPTPHLLDPVAWALRVLAGVSPLPLSSVYDWLLPLLMLLTLAALTIVFVISAIRGRRRRRDVRCRRAGRLCRPISRWSCLGRDRGRAAQHQARGARSLESVVVSGGANAPRDQLRRTRMSTNERHFCMCMTPDNALLEVRSEERFSGRTPLALAVPWRFFANPSDDVLL